MAMGPQTVEDWGASLQAPAGGYESMAMVTQPTAGGAVVTQTPADQRIQMTPAQIAAAQAPQQPVRTATASNWSKYALYALVGLGIYFMFIKKPGNDSREE